MQNRIAIVYQNMNVIPSISAIENIFTGQRITSRLGFLDRKSMESAAVRLFQALHVDIDPHAHLEDLTEAEQLMVEIAKALSIEPRASHLRRDFQQADPAGDGDDLPACSSSSRHGAGA